MLHRWLINLCLSLVFQLSWWLMCFGYHTYSESVNLILMRLSLKLRLRKKDWKLNIQYGVVNQCGGKKKEQHDKNTRRHCLAFIKHANLKAKKQNKTWYCSCLDLYSTHWIILLEEWIIYIIVHVCSFSCFEADAAPAVWRTSEVFRWNWKYCIEDESFDRTGGGKKASWLRGEIKMQRQETYSFL